MKTTTLNRTVLAALIGSALAFGWGAPAVVQAQDLYGRGKQADSGSDDDAAAKREAHQARKAQNDADAAADEAARGQAQAQARQRENEQRQNDQHQAQGDTQRNWNRAVDPPRQPDYARDDKPRQERDSAPAYADQTSYADQKPRREREPAPAYVEQKPRQEADRSYDRSRNDGQTVDTWRVADASRPDSTRYAGRNDSSRQDEGRWEDGRRVSDRRDDAGQSNDRHERSRDELIAEQRRQAEAFARQRDQRRYDADRWSRDLQSQHRSSGYRYQQDYWSRLSRQRYDWQNYDYYSDPYFYSAPSYRYYRGGQSYYINNYAADLLRQAINYGYREGIRAGQADRYDGWRFSYRDAYAYQDASYGYRGMYVSYSEYSYYFREGFRRGYEDGYYDNRRYGRYYNGSDNVLQTVLSLILDLRPYR